MRTLRKASSSSIGGKSIFKHAFSLLPLYRSLTNYLLVAIVSKTISTARLMLL